MGAPTSDMPVNASMEASKVDAVNAASEVSTFDAPVDASSASSWSDYSCHLPMNCYDGHGAVELDHEDVNRGASASSCAEACNKDQGCAGFVYMGSQRKCWRRSQIWLTECERGSWGQESSEFMTCLRQRTCKPQGQSCQNNGDCCDNNVCDKLDEDISKTCVPPPPSCKSQGESCQENGDCCDNNVCFLGGRPGQGLVCAPPTPSCKSQGESCQENGDCCDNNVCFLGGRPGQGLVC